MTLLLIDETLRRIELCNRAISHIRIHRNLPRLFLTVSESFHYVSITLQLTLVSQVSLYADCGYTVAFLTSPEGVNYCNQNPDGPVIAQQAGSNSNENQKLGEKKQSVGKFFYLKICKGKFFFNFFAQMACQFAWICEYLQASCSPNF